MINTSKAQQAIESGTTPKPVEVISKPARFALLLRPDQDPVIKKAEIQGGIPEAEVRFMSALERRVLILEIRDRLFVDSGSAFTAAHLLREAFDVKDAEADLPTDFYRELIDSTNPGEESVPDDFPPGCWSPTEPELENTWALAHMRVPEAWAFSELMQRLDRGEGIIIAQPDTGVITHPELEGIPRLLPRDVIDNDDDPTDPLLPGNPGHGTATASVCLSRAKRSVTGSAPKAIHMPIRAIENVTRVTQVRVAEAIDYAVSHGAHVITMSLGGLPSIALHRSILRAVAADLIVMAAAGNCVRFVVFPARYEDCIAVAGVTSTETPWCGTCRGSAVDIAAPAQNVLRAHVSSAQSIDVSQGQGTSFAVALTAGVAALWLAHHGRANLIASARARGETLHQMFRRLLMATARRPADWSMFEMGAGIVDAEALLRADLDAGRDRESAPPSDSTEHRSRIAVQSLILESTRLDPRTLPQALWDRHGAELAYLVYKSELNLPSHSHMPPLNESPLLQHQLPLSADLASTLNSMPELKSRLRIA